MTDKPSADNYAAGFAAGFTAGLGRALETARKAELICRDKSHFSSAEVLAALSQNISAQRATACGVFEAAKVEPDHT